MTLNKYAIPIEQAVQEAATLANDLVRTPLWSIEGVRDGGITIQQQAVRFSHAQDEETKRDAAAWAYEGYELLSRALPDTHDGIVPDERKTGWLTARDICALFGPEFVWNARVRLKFTPSQPDAAYYCADAEYLQGLLQITGKSQRAIAELIGLSARLLRYYMTPENSGKESRKAPYPTQYALERLAAHAIDSASSKV